MKQVVQEISSGNTIVLDVPVPSPQPGMALVRTAASLVSVGTERALVEFAGKSLLGKARSRPDLVKQVIEKVQREGLLTTFDAVQNRLDLRAAALDVHHGAGHVILIGFRPHWRGQPFGSFRVLFNAALYSGPVAASTPGESDFWTPERGGEK